MRLRLHNAGRIVLLPLALAVGLAPAAAGAQPPDLSLEDTLEKLHSNDAKEIREGIESIGLLGDPKAIAPLADRIRQGLPPQLLKTAIDTLDIMGEPDAGPILFELTSHRRPTVRRKALQAIASCGPEGAEGSLVHALSDTDPSVRGTAATGLGKLGAEGAIETLFAALERGVTEAAAAIGRIATGDAIDRLLGFLGKRPFDTLAEALQILLTRDDVAQDAKLDVIAALQELATGKVKEFLQEYVDSLPQSTRGRDPIRRAAEDAILRIVD